MYLIKNRLGVYCVRYKDNNNKFKQESLSTKNKHEAKSRLVIWKREMKGMKISEVEDLSDLFGSDQMNLMEILMYMKENLTSTKKSNILYHYEYAVRNWLEIIKDKPVDKITNQEIEEFRRKCLELNKSESTINFYLRNLKSMCNKARDFFEIIKTNPFIKIQLFKIPEKKRMIFSDEEISKLWSVIENPTHLAIYKFLYYTGCRLDEAVNLKWSNVDFENGFVEISNDETFTTKSKKNRKIPMNTLIRNLLNEITNTGNDYVFISEQKTKFSKFYISKRFQKYLDKAKIPALKLHCLRHTFCTNFVQKTGNISYAKLLLGHQNISTTQTYLHVSEKQLSNAMDLMC